MVAGSRRVRRFARGAQARRLPAGRHADLPRHDRARVPAVRGGGARDGSRQGRRAHQGDRPALRPGRRRRQAGRRAVEGLPAARRAGAGDAARPRHRDPGRADQRPRPEPDRRDPLADQGDRPREDGHPVDAHPARGAGDLQPRRHHQRRQAGRRRHARRAARARARRPLPRRRRIQRRPQGRHPRPARQPGGRGALRGDRRRGRLARVRHRRGRRRAICASRSSAPRSTTAGRCSSWRANRPAWKTFSATSPPEKKASHEPGPRHIAARDPHLFQLAGRVHRRLRLHPHHRLPVLHAAVRGATGGHARLLRQHAAAVHVPGAGDHDAPAGRREGVGDAGAADHHARPRLGGGGGQVPGGDGAARARRWG